LAQAFLQVLSSKLFLYFLQVLLVGSRLMWSSDSVELRQGDPSHFPEPVCDLLCTGVRRDLSSQFFRLRSLAAPSPRRKPSPRSPVPLARPSAPTDTAIGNHALATAFVSIDAANGISEPAALAEQSTPDDCTAIYMEASSMHTSLVSKLAQHNGLRRFSADFADRVPPLEWRLLLPELEASIQALLEGLERLLVRLQLIEVSADGADRRLHDALGRYVSGALAKTKGAFGEQQEHLKELSAASPLRSPVLAPGLADELRSSSPSSSGAASPALAPSPRPMSPLAPMSPLPPISRLPPPATAGVGLPPPPPPEEALVKPGDEPQRYSSNFVIEMLIEKLSCFALPTESDD